MWSSRSFSLRIVADLATIPPCDYDSENNVQGAEAGREKKISPRSRGKQGRAAEDHEAQAHQGDDANREGAAGSDTHTVEKQPRAGNRGGQAEAVESHGEKDGGKNTGGEAGGKFSSGTGEERPASFAGLGERGPCGNGDADYCFSHPDQKPRLNGVDARGDESCADSGDAHDDAAPSRYGGKGGGALHGFADETDVLAGVLVNRNGSGDGRMTARCL